MLKNNHSPSVDLSDIGHIERIVIGKYNEKGIEDDAQMQRQIERLNAFLSGSPKGVLIGKDCGFKIIRFGEHTVASQQIAYHVGFKRKPVIR